MTHTCNPRTWEAEAEGQHAQGQPQLHSEAVQKTNKKKGLEILRGRRGQWPPTMEALTRPLCHPGFPPIQGLESAEPSQQSLVGVLETAMKLANHDEGSDDEEEETPKKVQGGQG